MRIGIVAGEASGDILGAELIQAIRARFPSVEVRGIGGPRMAAAGVECLFDADELAVMGLVEVLGRLPRLLSIRRSLLRTMREWCPDVFVGIDSPDFNLPVETVLKADGIRTAHLVSPTVWAWRPGRVQVVARAADTVLCLFPFEPACYSDTDVAAVFVGHPLAERLAPAPHPRGGAPVLAVLPGSRHSEVKHLGPAFAKALALLATRGGAMRVRAPMVTGSLADRFRAQCRAYAPGVDVEFVEGGSHEVLRAADVALVASGTATLEALLLDTPMVVAYRVSAISAWLFRVCGLLRTDRFALPNVLAGRDVVPELIQQAATPEALSRAVASLLDDPGRAAAQRQEFAALRHVLKVDSANRAADAVIALAGR